MISNRQNFRCETSTKFDFCDLCICTVSSRFLFYFLFSRRTLTSFALINFYYISSHVSFCSFFFFTKRDEKVFEVLFFFMLTTKVHSGNDCLWKRAYRCDVHIFLSCIFHIMNRTSKNTRILFELNFLMIFFLNLNIYVKTRQWVFSTFANWYISMLFDTYTKVLNITLRMFYIQSGLEEKIHLNCNWIGTCLRLLYIAFCINIHAFNILFYVHTIN